MTPESPVNRRKFLSGIATLGGVSLAGCMGARGKSSSEPSSSESIHWHVNLTIEINGESYPVPKNVGIGPQYSDSPYYHSGMQMTSIHTHDNSGTLHWEISGRSLKEGEGLLGAFFDIWDKPFSVDRLFDHSTDDGELTMLVNGSSNDQFDEYRVQHGDEILIRFEESGEKATQPVSPVRPEDGRLF